MTPEEKQYRRAQRADVGLAVIILTCILVMVVLTLVVLLLWVWG